jgi:hypothetical protein
MAENYETRTPYPTWARPAERGTVDPFTFGGIPDTEWLGSDLAGGFLDDPANLWRTGRAQQMTQQQLANPFWTRQANVGFTPTLGEYLLGGAPRSFGEYLGEGRPVNMGGYRTPDQATGWKSALAASRALLEGLSEEEIEARETAGTLTAGQVTQMGLMGTAPEARRNTLAMTMARMGGGVGMGATARERAVGNMYDIYAARQAGTGDPQGGFIDWINRRLSF